MKSQKPDPDDAGEKIIFLTSPSMNKEKKCIEKNECCKTRWGIHCTEKDDCKGFNQSNQGMVKLKKGRENAELWQGNSKLLGKSVKSKYLAGWMEVIIKVMKWFGMKPKRDNVKRTILDIYMGISSDMLKSEDGTNSVICSIQ